MPQSTSFAHSINLYLLDPFHSSSYDRFDSALIYRKLTTDRLFDAQTFEPRSRKLKTFVYRPCLWFMMTRLLDGITVIFPQV